MVWCCVATAVGRKADRPGFSYEIRDMHEVIPSMTDEDAPVGLRVNVRNGIPMNCGLGAEAAMTVAGLVVSSRLFRWS